MTTESDRLVLCKILRKSSKTVSAFKVYADIEPDELSIRDYDPVHP